ncbi:MAG TPA: glycosyltransferase [Candidatus Scalindua sp.]|nr:glycosyltransferase [Candidatus Scalindua sp.]
MKIAHIGQKGIPATFGGVDFHVEELSKRLVERGHKIDVYVRNWHTDRKLREYRGIKLIHTSTIRTKHLDAFMHSLTSSLHSVSQDYDIVHYHGLGATVFCGLPKISRSKVVATIHGLDWQRGKWGSFAKVFLKFTERTATYIPDKTIVVSMSQKKYFESKYKKEFIYIPNGVNIPQGKPVSEIIKEKYDLNGEDYLLWMGRLTPEKRVDWLIKAFKEIKDRVPNLKLVIAGGTSATDGYVKTLKEFTQDNERIIFTGYVAGQEKEELFSNALLFTLPSYLEGLPIALLEAMSHRLACLVSDIEPHREIISGGVDGLFFQSNSFSDFVKKLGRLLENPERLRNIGENARRKVKKEYNWDEVVRKTEEIYQELI